MAWTPAHSATDIRAILGNLITFFSTNQVAALAWASPSRLLTPLNLYRTAETRIKTDFPHFGVVKRRVVTDDADDGLRIRYDLTFEIEIAAEHTDATRTTVLTQLMADTDNVVYAFESMFLNIPKATLMAGITGTSGLYKLISSSDPVEAAISNVKSLFNVQMNAVLEFRENP